MGWSTETRYFDWEFPLFQWQWRRFIKKGATILETSHCTRRWFDGSIIDVSGMICYCAGRLLDGATILVPN